MEMDKVNMNATEIATYLGISRNHVWKLRSLYKIPFVKLGSRIIFNKIAIDKWLHDRTIHSLEQEYKTLKVPAVAARVPRF